MQEAPPNPQLVSQFVIAVFRLNGRLLEIGNGLVADLGLTTAWWQVLGALSLSPVPLPVAHIARNMGLTRQSVQRVVDLLADKGMVSFEANPHHQRAKLVVLTRHGRDAAEAADRRQEPLSEEIMAALGVDRITVALEVLAQLDRHLAQASPENLSNG